MAGSNWETEESWIKYFQSCRQVYRNNKDNAVLNGLSRFCGVLKHIQFLKPSLRKRMQNHWYKSMYRNEFRMRKKTSNHKLIKLQIPQISQNHKYLIISLLNLLYLFNTFPYFFLLCALWSSHDIDIILHRKNRKLIQTFPWHSLFLGSLFCSVGPWVPPYKRMRIVQCHS